MCPDVNKKLSFSIYFIIFVIYMESRYTKDNKYYQETAIPCYDADASFHLKPAAFMDLAQELAYWAAGELGFGFDNLQTHGTAWVLSRMHIRFIDMPLWRDRVRLITWHKGLEGLFFLRDFRMEDETGKERIACTSSWLVVDAQTHRLMRSDRLENMVQPHTQSPDNAIEVSCPKVQLPRGIEAEKVGEHRVSYSDLDILGHTNNAATWSGRWIASIPHRLRTPALRTCISTL